MSKKRILSVLTSGVAAASLLSNAANALPTLPHCVTSGVPVTLQILTGTASNWKVNGAPAILVSNGSWANASPANWIGVSGFQAGVQTYEVRFHPTGHPGPMTVSVHWAADNCGISLQAGTGPVQSTGPCYGHAPPAGYDFMNFNHVTTANFSSADSGAPHVPIRFTIANAPSSQAGFAGIFTVTAQCP